jgi:predicted TIM-barrel fold metal-dependent hydrolase
LGYREYLERRWWDDFDAWAESFVNPFGDLDEVYADRNWNSPKRLQHLEDDGIVAEVIFPNTVPPFYPVTGTVAGPPSPADYERRCAGLKAHNRWLVDFCADAPGRRAGIAQVLFNDPVDAVSEIEWARAQGLSGGILMPSIPPGACIAPIWDESYEPIWAACEDMDIPLNHHGGGGTPDYGWERGMARIVYLTEFTFYSNRNLWHLIWGGVFERHPALRYAITEQGFGAILDEARVQDGYFAMLRGAGDTPAARGARGMIGDYIDTLPAAPSEYLKRNCWFGASFMTAADAARRHEIGVDRVMWGADYPHEESTWPNSRTSLGQAVVGIPESEVRQMVGENAASFYGFDLDALSALADTIGPQSTELAMLIA